METVLTSPASYKLFGSIPMVIISLLIILIGGGLFLYLILKRVAPLFKAAPSAPIDRIRQRIENVFDYAHHRMLRYKLAAMIHFCFLFGLSIIAFRWLGLLLIGIWDGFLDVLPGFAVIAVDIYMYLSQIVGTIVLIACIVAMVRRGIFRPERYAVPERFGKSHTPETIFALFIIAVLMICDMVFQGSVIAADVQEGLGSKFLIPGTGVWVTSKVLGSVPVATLQNLHIGSYFLHEIIFFLFVCFMPFSRFFHILTFFPDLFLMKLNKGSVKPVQWGVDDDKLDELESFGVQKLEDFSWKYLLDFMSCADCGRCSDHCPANAVGRPLSPRFITIKARELMYKNYPILGKKLESKPLIGGIYDEDEIWSCTTCGACEEECPLTIEYIDKMVDLRRGMVDEGNVPQSLQKPLSAIEKRGNPWGKMEKNRADWTMAEGFAENTPVKILDGSSTA
ncbi:MAG: (Fe-S)-binding protein, partial [Desulfobacterales bacterium]|nr:(Fe-S)-binding protein [Desulfobacterales bacterium]